ncbi:hypothetical protein L596_027823 [Steinernema carpocapsae]|uniref:Uncharacterized protein n=1 Tax=Steinernema carpocapsae TaxID=34508 RepID=A0A4U5LWM4_STECR|nr:hypothetical protein L596_027823 [Steinernema carpocapsae]
MLSRLNTFWLKTAGVVVCSGGTFGCSLRIRFLCDFANLDRIVGHWMILQYLIMKTSWTGLLLQRKSGPQTQ